MAASLNDEFTLGQDGIFQNRVQASLSAACVAIVNEFSSTPLHSLRSKFASSVLLNPPLYAALFANSVATSSDCIADATQGGTVVLTILNRSQQAALVTDAHINTAVAAQYNAFLGST